jgi:D-aspartate ligase
MTSGKAIIIGRGFNALNIVWTLQAAGVDCTVMCDKRTIAGWSRYARFAQCPDAATDETSFQQFLMDYCKTCATKPVIIPTNDKWANAVARVKADLSPFAHCCVADADLVHLLLDKEKFSKLGVERSYGTLPSYNAEEVRLLKDEDFPIIAKPNVREVSTNFKGRNALQARLSSLRLSKIVSKPELLEFLKLYEADLGQFVFQPYVAGNCSNMFSICVFATAGGHVTGWFAGRKLRGYPVEYGDCARGESWSAPTEMLENVTRICKETGLEGIAEFEFKRDERTKTFHLIEINPRSWSWIGITASLADNLPLIAFDHYARPAAISSARTLATKEAATYGFFLSELASLFKYRNNPFGATLNGVIRDYFSKRVIAGDLNWRDPLPGLVAVSLAIRSLLRKS